MDNILIIRYLAFSVFISLLAIFAVRYLKTKLTVPRGPVIIFFVLWLFYIFFSSVGLVKTTILSDGLFALSKMLLTVIFIYLLFKNFPKPDFFIEIFSKTIVIVSIVISAIGFYQISNVYAKEGLSHAALYGVTVTFGQKNLFAEYIFLCLPFAVYVTLVYKKIWRILGVISSISILAIITICMTRSVWVAAVVGIVCTSILGLIVIGYKSIDFRKILVSLLVTVFVVVGISLLYSKVDKSSAITKQVNKIFNFQYGTTKDRLVLWQKSLHVFNESPLFGTGLGSWKVEVLKYGNNDLISSENNLIFYQRPHNDYIWILCEQGVLALTSYLFMIIFSLYLCIRILKRTSENKTRLFVLALFFFQIGYSIVACFSFPLERIEHNILLSLVFAFILILYNYNLPPKRKPFVISSKVGILVILFTLFAVVFGVQRFRSELHVKKAFSYRANGYWDMEIREIDKAYGYFNQMDPFSTPLLWYRGHANFMQNRIPEAYADFQTAFAINPYHIYVLNDLGTCSGMLGKTDEALSFFKQAVSIAPNFEDALFNISTIYFNYKKLDSAYYYFSNIENPKDEKKYEKYLSAIVQSKIRMLYQTVNESDLNQVIDSICTSKPCLTDIIRKSKVNKHQFEKQALLDAIQILKNKNSSFDIKREEQLKLKFNL